MKHIARQFLNHLTAEELGHVKKSHPGKEYSRGKDATKIAKRTISKNEVTYLTTTKGVHIQGFRHKISGQDYTFPEPNPTLIYFASAQRFRREIETIKPILLPKLNTASTNEGEFTHNLYSYYGAVCGTVIFLATSLESFMNSLFEPKDVYKTNIKGEPLNFSQLQRKLSFDEKIKAAIPELRKKNFFKDHPKEGQFIAELQEFRDNFIHTKTRDSVVKHDYLIKKSFSFKYDETIQAVFNYMNYYRPGSISECTCGADI